MRFLPLVLVFVGAPAVQAEAVDYDHRLTCDVEKTYTGDEEYQDWRKSVGLEPAPHQPQQGSLDISFNPPGLGRVRTKIDPVAINATWSDGVVEMGQGFIARWSYLYRSDDSELTMQIRGKGRAFFSSLTVSSNRGNSKTLELSGRQFGGGPHIPSYSIRISGTCQFLADQLS